MDSFSYDTSISVEDVDHPLARSQDLSLVAQADGFVAEPSIVHFSGFDLGIPQSRVVRILNIGQKPGRMHILPSQTETFSLSFNKTGVIPPGLSEDLTITFVPKQVKYYFDTVRVHTGIHNLLIPCHAYPAVNRFSFPKRLDFGVCAAGQAVSKTLTVSTDTPLDFEFRCLLEASAHDAFSVEPNRGLIRAREKLELTVTFAPPLLATFRQTLTFTVADLNGEDYKCELLGSAKPGIVRQQLMERAAAMNKMQKKIAIERLATDFASTIHEFTVPGNQPQDLGNVVLEGLPPADVQDTVRPSLRDAAFLAHAHAQLSQGLKTTGISAPSPAQKKGKARAVGQGDYVTDTIAIRRKLFKQKPKRKIPPHESDESGSVTAGISRRHLDTKHGVQLYLTRGGKPSVRASIRSERKEPTSDKARKIIPDFCVQCLGPIGVSDAVAAGRQDELVLENEFQRAFLSFRETEGKKFLSSVDCAGLQEVTGDVLDGIREAENVAIQLREKKEREHFVDTFTSATFSNLFDFLADSEAPTHPPEPKPDELSPDVSPLWKKTPDPTEIWELRKSVVSRFRRVAFGVIYRNRYTWVLTRLNHFLNKVGRTTHAVASYMRAEQKKLSCSNVGSSNRMPGTGVSDQTAKDVCSLVEVIAELKPSKFKSVSFPFVEHGRLLTGSATALADAGAFFPQKTCLMLPRAHTKEMGYGKEVAFPTMLPILHANMTEKPTRKGCAEEDVAVFVSLAPETLKCAYHPEKHLKASKEVLDGLSLECFGLTDAPTDVVSQRLAFQPLPLPDMTLKTPLFRPAAVASCTLLLNAEHPFASAYNSAEHIAGLPLVPLYSDPLPKPYTAPIELEEDLVDDVGEVLADPTEAEAIGWGKLRSEDEIVALGVDSKSGQVEAMRSANAFFLEQERLQRRWCEVARKKLEMVEASLR